MPAARGNPGARATLAVARLLLRTNGMTATPAIFPLSAPAPPRSFPPGTQLNWLVRYVPIKQYLTGPALASLIEVGSGARGLASIIDDPFGIARNSTWPPGLNASIRESKPR